MDLVLLSLGMQTPFTSYSTHVYYLLLIMHLVKMAGFHRPHDLQTLKRMTSRDMDPYDSLSPNTRTDNVRDTVAPMKRIRISKLISHSQGSCNVNINGYGGDKIRSADSRT
jgi:hypothetical protein